jgi:hypothetical protein
MLALSKEPNRVGVCLPPHMKTEAGPVSQTLCSILFRFPSHPDYSLTLQVPSPTPALIFPEAGGSLETSRSTLELEADSATFRDTKLRLRCEAWLYKLYRRSSDEVELHEDTPQLASVLGPSIAGKVITRVSDSSCRMNPHHAR